MTRKDGWTKLRFGEHWVHAGWPMAVVSSVRDDSGWLGYRVTIGKQVIGHFDDWGKVKDVVRLASLGVNV